MTDSELTELIARRDSSALSELKAKYGAYCLTTAMNILRSKDDAEECLDDAFLALWQSIPPAKPEDLKMYLAALTRSAAISRWRKLHAKKRGSGHIELLLEELSDAAASDSTIEKLESSLALREAFNAFLGSLPEEQRRIFLRRYWFMHTVAEIAQALGMTESKVKVTLHRARKKLKKMLEREGLL
ncbi:RNA polymerase sigma-70 factor, ECF subfamily [Ruminococcaceae bacterium FB2012]|nr:RNA polymerase sigma-70 factor, ECF subfamily [Ruminococcaceae bacterium FB2012]